MTNRVEGWNRAHPGGDAADGPTAGEDWSVPRPLRLPRPPLWPAAAALGIVLLLWGVVTAWLVAGTGAALLALSAAGWIRELQHDREGTP